MVDLHLVRGGAGDLLVLTGVPLVLVAIGITASWLPARKAAAVEASEALRTS
jgi:ABC-type lipoprotein release transport system permease subunit